MGDNRNALVKVRGIHRRSVRMTEREALDYLASLGMSRDTSVPQFVTTHSNGTETVTTPYAGNGLTGTIKATFSI